MAISTFSIRMDEQLKSQFDALCLEFGMNATTAFNVFARAVVRERRIPFEIRAQEAARQEGRKAFEELRRQAAENGIQNMSLEEINEEICQSREEETE